MKNHYLISKEVNKTFKYNQPIYGYYINHNFENHEIAIISDQEKKLIVIGDFVNAQEPTLNLKENAEKLFRTETITDLIHKTDYYTGRYLVLFGKHGQLKYVLPDPVGTIPVNYSFVNNEMQISSQAYYIATYLSLEQSKESIEIKRGAEEQQPLPYNLTIYEEIKVLLPNHFLNIQEQKVERFFPTAYMPAVSMDEAVAETIKYTKNVLKAYSLSRKLSLPLTSGRDSRTILALMKDYIEDIETYTMHLNHLTLDSGDIKIPKEITKHLGIKHSLLPLLTVPEHKRYQIHTVLDGLENDDVLDQAYSYYKSNLSERYSVPGEIITLGKSLFGKNLPESFVSLNYLMTKTHNYSSEARKHVKIWLDDVKGLTKSSNLSVYDLFALEYRLGRWLPNSIQNYEYFRDTIFIFNMRYLIQMWMRISKKERTKRSLHLEIITKEWPELLDFDMNPDNKLKDSLFSNSYLFYFGSHLKYLFNKRYFKRNKR